MTLSKSKRRRTDDGGEKTKKRKPAIQNTEAPASVETCDTTQALISRKEEEEVKVDKENKVPLKRGALTKEKITSPKEGEDSDAAASQSSDDDDDAGDALNDEDAKRTRIRKDDADDADGESSEEEEENEENQEDEEDDAAEPVFTAHGPLKGLQSAFNTIMERERQKKKGAVILSEMRIGDSEAQKKEEERKRREERDKRRQMKAKLALHKAHVMPDVLQKSFEMDLRKIATKGVVRLFNSVQTAQAEEAAEKARAEKKDEESRVSKLNTYIHNE